MSLPLCTKWMWILRLPCFRSLTFHQLLCIMRLRESSSLNLTVPIKYWIRKRRTTREQRPPGMTRLASAISHNQTTMMCRTRFFFRLIKERFRAPSLQASRSLTLSLNRDNLENTLSSSQQQALLPLGWELMANNSVWWRNRLLWNSCQFLLLQGMRNFKHQQGNLRSYRTH